MPREIDANGWMQVLGNPITKVGIFDYLGSEINGPVADKIYRVYRPAEELQKQETLDSFKLLPFIDEHTPLGVHGTPAEQKGIQGMIGEQVYFDAPYVRGNIKVLSNAAMAQIGAGKIELSPGYACRYEFTPGSFDGEMYDAIQRDIRGNHLALVDEGRTGPDVAMQDSKPKQTITIDTAELLPMEFTPEQLAQIEALIAKVLAAQGAAATGDEDPEKKAAMDEDPETKTADATPEEEAAMAAAAAGEPVAPTAAEGDAAEEAVAMSEQATAALEEAQMAIEEVAAAAEEIVAAADSKSRKIAQDKLTVAKRKLNTAKAKQSKIAQDSRNGKMGQLLDSLTKEVAALKKRPAVQAMDTGALLKEVGARDALASRVSNFVGTFDHSMMTVDGVCKYALDKIGIKAPKGQERIALDSWLHGRKPAHQEIITQDTSSGTLSGAWAKQAEAK